MEKDLTPQQKELAQAISEISEKCYCAGWLKNLEYVLWDALKNGERNYVQDRITKPEIKNLKQLSRVANSWIYFNNDEDELAILLDQWKILNHETLAKNPNIING